MRPDDARVLDLQHARDDARVLDPQRGRDDARVLDPTRSPTPNRRSNETSSCGSSPGWVHSSVRLMLRPSVVEAALAEGVTFFDTADVYGSGRSEEILGELLADRRDQVMFATKFGMDMGDGRGPRGSCDYITRAVEGPLRRLRTEVIDF